MRDIGLPKVLTWRWAPCAALVAGSLSFVAFALVVIPDRIGSAMAQAPESPQEMALASSLGRAVLPTSGSNESDWSHPSEAATNLATTPGSRVMSRPNDQPFPRRGFSPPLERPDPPPPAPPPLSTPPPPPPSPAAPSEAPANQVLPGSVLPFAPPGSARIAPEAPAASPPAGTTAPPGAPAAGVVPQASNDAQN